MRASSRALAPASFSRRVRESRSFHSVRPFKGRTLAPRGGNSQGHVTYSKWGKPWKERSLNQAFDRLLEKLAKEGLARDFRDIHGLRHARGMELAYGGASEFQIMAQLEHTTPFTARIYIRQANRAKGANDGQTKVDDLIRRRMAKKQREQG